MKDLWKSSPGAKERHEATLKALRSRTLIQDESRLKSLKSLKEITNSRKERDVGRVYFTVLPGVLVDWLLSTTAPRLEDY